MTKLPKDSSTLQPSTTHDQRVEEIEPAPLSPEQEEKIKGGLGASKGLDPTKLAAN